MGGVTRGQVSLEYLFIVGFAFVLLVPVIVLFYTQHAGISDEVIGAQAQKVMDELVSGIDTVHFLGPPSRQTLKLRFPDGVNSVTVQDNIIIFSIESSSAVYELTGRAAANVTGTIDPYKGVHILTVTAEDTGVRVVEN